MSKSKSRILRLIILCMIVALSVACVSVSLVACGDKDQGKNPSPGHTNHIYNDWTTENPATCTEDGLKKRTCKECDHFEQEVIPATGHSYGEWKTETPVTGCTVNGTKTRTCSKCGDVDSDIIPASHSYGDWQTGTPATCTTDGTKYRICSKCNDNPTEIVPATGHSYGDWQTGTPAGCTTDGTKYRICSKCDDKETDDIPATDHSYGDWQTGTPATCTTDGTKYRVCSECGDKDTDTITAAGHNYEDGVCSVCGQREDALFNNAELLANVEHFIGYALSNDESDWIVYGYLINHYSDFGVDGVCYYLIYSVGESGGCEAFIFNTDSEALAIMDYLTQSGDDYTIAGNVVYLESEKGLYESICAAKLPENVISEGALTFIRNAITTEYTVANRFSCFTYSEDGLFSLMSEYPTTGNCKSMYMATTNPEYFEDYIPNWDGSTPVENIGPQFAEESYLHKNGDYYLGYLKEKAGVYFEENEDGSGYILTNYRDDTGIENFVIPALHNGKPVVAIGEDAFSDCTSIVSITISDSITSIGNYAFEGCGALESISIGRSVTQIGYNVFSGCASLTSVTVDANNTVYGSVGNCLIDKANKILIRGFNNSTIPTDGSVTSIGNGAFEGCTGLVSVTIPDCIVSIDSSFYGCTSLESVTIGRGVSSIDTYAFERCTSLTSITVDANNPTYSSAGNCLIHKENKALIKGFSNSVIPTDGSVTSIYSNAFYGCTGLESITIPNSVTSIGSAAFYGCTGLVSVTIPSGVTHLNYDTFGNCTNLANITILGDVTYIDRAAFRNTAWYDNLPDGLVYIGNFVYMYKGTMPANTNITLKPGTTAINGYAFKDCTGLKSITIPANVTSISYGAFEGCENLSAVHITDLTKWCEIYFDYNTNPLAVAHNLYLNDVLVTELVIPDGVTNIGSCAFQGCTSITSVTIPSSVTYIGYSAFENCSSITDVYYDGTEEQWHYIDGSWQFDAYNVHFNGNNDNEDNSYELRFSLNFDNCSYSVDNISHNNGNHIEVVIPDMHEGLPVTEIWRDAFRDCMGIVRVTIGGNVTSIGESAFMGCFGLTEIYIPANVTSIGPAAFASCNNLVSITVESGNPAYHSFNDCLIETATKTLIAGCMNSMIPNDGSVEVIGEAAFMGCSHLVSIYIPDSVTSIGSEAFYECTSLTDITISTNVESIGHNAFNFCTSLRSLSIPSSVTSLGAGVFTDCTSLESAVILARVSSIGDYFFCNCTSLTEVYIPNGAAQIGSWAFFGCTSLNSIYIPDSVTDMAFDAFYGCDNLTDVYYQGSEEQWNNINGSDEISATVHYNSTRQEIGDNGDDNNEDDDDVNDTHNYELQYAVDLNTSSFYKVHKIKLDAGATNVKVVIPDTYDNLPVTVIDDDAFKDCTELVSVILPDSVTSIGSSAFRGCTKLTSITMNCVTTINGNAFNGCTSLKSITLGDSVESIGNGAFQNCTSLTDVTLNDNITNIIDNAFSGCTSLVNITIPDNAERIGTSAFQGCASLVEINVPASVTYIGYNAFKGCTSLTDIYYGGTEEQWSTLAQNAQVGQNVTVHFECDGNNDDNNENAYELSFEPINNNTAYSVTGINITTDSNVNVIIPNMYEGFPVTAIGDYAFWECSGLTSITIPDSVTSIGNHAFHKCSGLTSITISDCVTNIGWDAFGYCSGLTSVTIPDCVTSIGYQVFYECSGLMNITIGGSVTSIGDQAFMYCTGLTSVTIGNSVTSIGEDAFFGCSGLTSITVDANNSIYHSIDNCLIETATKTLILGCQNSVIPSDESVTSIGYGAFSGCSSLTSVTIPDSVTSIDGWAFVGCSGLTSITIPASVTSIGDYAFFRCSGLTSIIIPDSVESIGSGVFSECSSLTDIYYGGTEEQWNAIDGSDQLSDYTIHFTDDGGNETTTAMK